MKILITAATPFEVAPLREYLDKHFEQEVSFHYYKKELKVILLVTGVGISQTSYSLGKAFAQDDFNLVMNAGIAGAFDRSLQIGEVVNVISERFGDLGVEEADGSFTDMYEMELIPGNQFPYQNNGELMNDKAADSSFLRTVKGLTVNKVHGFAPSIERIQQKYPDVQIESMEGAAFFQACLLETVPFLAIRSISNYVESRNRENWDLEAAIVNLNKVLIASLETLFHDEQ